MKVVKTALEGVLLLEPRRFSDDRGWFYESYSRRTLAESAGIATEFVQDNHSSSALRVLRGLHYQVGPSAQGKLVRATRGEVFDVAVDLREGSPTFGRWTSAILSAENRLQIWIPVGFAHGFLSLAEGAEVAYKATSYYDPGSERSIRWDDPDLAIEWPAGTPPRLSPKDAAAPPFRGAERFRIPGPAR